MPSFTQNFPLTAQTASVPNTTTILVNPNTTFNTISPYVFGTGSWGMSWEAGNVDQPAVVQQGFLDTYEVQNWKMYRATNATGSLAFTNPNSIQCQRWFNNSPISSSGKNWKQVFNNETDPDANDWTKNRLMFCLGASYGSVWGPGASTNEFLNGNQAVQIAQNFKNGGMECFYWESPNECNGWVTLSGGTQQPDYVNNFIDIRNKLKAFNPKYKVGGAATAGIDTTWASAMANNGADFMSFHNYAGTANPAGEGQWAVDNFMGPLMNISSTIPVFYGEYNHSNSGDPSTTSITGALVSSAILGQSLLVPNSTLKLGGIWTLSEGGSGWSMTNSDGSVKCPNAYLLGALGRNVRGLRCQTSRGSSLPQTSNAFQIIATKDGTNWAVWISNYSGTSVPNYNLQGFNATGSTFREWKISGQTPTITTRSQTALTDNSLSIANNTIVILSNA